MIPEQQADASKMVPLTAYHARQLTAKGLGGNGGSIGHDFRQQLMPQDNTNEGRRQPMLSKAGQYYLDCVICGRPALDDDGGGSASQVFCNQYNNG